ncbi:MAG: Tab2/Atab2 family RNA-binding protein [Xenococcaceae cyanobacterium MO_188.B32]|nr:Tab2/Atab2 family RNA-binding protein [Xenococcaceae cyanobacterium MO_188.B32]
MGKIIWELDFYSRPILDENKKKLWEVVICESPTSIDRSLDSLFQYSQYCSNQTVNSIWLREAIEKAIQEAEAPPKKIRFFRRQMNNMITKACNDAGITAIPSRRTYALYQLLEKRTREVYPNEPGYDAKAANSASVQYPAMNAVPLPDAVRGDRGDKWAFVSLEAADFAEMKEWDISFGEAFPLSLANVTPETKIPGLIIYSPRAIALAAWMSGLEMGWLQLETGTLPRLLLETGVSDNWILVNLTTPQTVAEAKKFDETKDRANGVHFLAVQSSSESDSFAGFWLLKN